MNLKNNGNTRYFLNLFNKNLPRPIKTVMNTNSEPTLGIKLIT